MDLTVVLNEFGSLFRDIADEDYVSARSNYQLRLREQFFWAGLQALEKYLKAILLHNQVSTREYGHDLIKLYEAVQQIGWLKFTVPTTVEKFLERARLLGDNRYMSTDSYVRPENLEELDESVWNIRPYCRFVRVTVKTGKVDLTDVIVKSINSRAQCRDPREYKPFSIGKGVLEKTLDKPSSDPARRALVWHNRFYGSSRSKYVTPPRWSSSRVPPNRRHWFTPTVKSQVEHYIRFPRDRSDIFSF